MPLFAPLSAAERKSLRAAPALTLPQQLASMLQLHHTRVIDLFRVLDKNGDGEVTKPELAEARATRDEGGTTPRAAAPTPKTTPRATN